MPPMQAEIWRSLGAGQSLKSLGLQFWRTGRGSCMLIHAGSRSPTRYVGRRINDDSRH
jgi:hypothetical protein